MLSNELQKRLLDSSFFSRISFLSAYQSKI